MGLLPPLLQKHWLFSWIMRTIVFPALPPTVEDSSHMKEETPGMGDICFWSLRTIYNLPHICATKRLSRFLFFPKSLLWVPCGGSWGKAGKWRETYQVSDLWFLFYTGMLSQLSLSWFADFSAEFFSPVYITATSSTLWQMGKKFISLLKKSPLGEI